MNKQIKTLIAEKALYINVSIEEWYTLNYLINFMLCKLNCKVQSTSFNLISIGKSQKYLVHQLVLKVVSATFLLVCFIFQKERTCKTRKNTFYFTSKALLVLEIINF